MTFQWQPLILALTLTTLFACSKKGGGDGDVSESELDKIRENALPAIADADYEEFKAQIERLRYLPSFHDKIVRKLGNNKYYSMPGPSSFGELSAETSEKLGPNCKLENPEDPEHIKVTSTNGCPVDISFDRKKDMKFEGSPESSIKIWAKVNENLRVQYLSPEMQSASGFISLSYSGKTDLSGTATGKTGNGRSLKKKTLDVQFSSPEYPRISVRMAQKQTIQDKTVHLIERGYFTLNGKTYVVTWFRDDTNNDPNDRVYIGNRLWKGIRWFNLPVSILGDHSFEK